MVFWIPARQKRPSAALHSDKKVDRPESQVEGSGAADQEGANQRKNAQPLYAVKGWMSLTDKCVEKEHNLKLSRSNTKSLTKYKYRGRIRE